MTHHLKGLHLLSERTELLALAPVFLDELDEVLIELLALDTIQNQGELGRLFEL